MSPEPHGLVVEHGTPLERQRRPPQTVAPTATQSAFDMHGVAAALLHVSQKHFGPPNPVPLQFGLSGVIVTVCVPVESGTTPEMNWPYRPWLEGQSKLVSPKVGLTASIWQGRPSRAPP